MSHLEEVLTKSNGIKRKETDSLDISATEKKARSDASVSDESVPVTVGGSLTADDQREEDLDQEAFADLEAVALMEGVNIEDLLALVDQAGPVQEMDDVQLKQALSRLQRALDKNAELRIKYPDDPTKFMMSEVDVDECITALTTVATEPALFPSLAANGIELLLQVLLHDNADLGVAVVELLSQIIDEDELSCIIADEEQPVDLASEDTTQLLAYMRGSWAIVNALHAHGGFRILVQYLLRLNEQDVRHQSAIAAAFSLFTAMVDVAPGMARVLLENTPIFAFALFRTKYAATYIATTPTAGAGTGKATGTGLVVAADGQATNAATLATSTTAGGPIVPANRLAAAELLLALTQSCATKAADAVSTQREAMQRLWDAVLGHSQKRDRKSGTVVRGGVCTCEDGVVDLLCSFAPYRKVKKITDATENEFLATITTILSLLMSTSLAHSPCRELLGKAQGLELLVDCMGRGGVVGEHALRVVESWAEENEKNKALVDRGVLKVLFPLWAAHQRKATGNHLLVCERSVSLVHHLLFTLQDTYLLRLVQKFREDSFAKCGYLYSLLSQALTRLAKAEAQHRLALGLRAVPDVMVGYGSVDTYAGSGSGVKVEVGEEDESGDVWGGEEEADRYLRRLGNGLFVCQRVCLVMAMLMCVDSSKGKGDSVEEALGRLFEQGNIDLEVVVNMCKEYCKYLGEGAYKNLVQMTIGALQNKIE